MKKRDGFPKSEAEGGRKSLQFVGVLNGEYVPFIPSLARVQAPALADLCKPDHVPVPQQGKKLP